MKILGNSNSQIIDTLVTDLVVTSAERDEITLSPEVIGAVEELKAFNYSSIYKNEKVNSEKEKVGRAFDLIFRRFLRDVKGKNRESLIYRHFLDKRPLYVERTSPPEMVRDYIATMTDRYFVSVLQDCIIPAVQSAGWEPAG